MHHARAILHLRAQGIPTTIPSACARIAMLPMVPLNSGRTPAARWRFCTVDPARQSSRRVDKRRKCFRRPFAVTAVLTFTVQMIVAASPTVTACVDRPHTHGGVAASDCPMHHQAPGTPAGTEHAHHNHASSTPPIDGHPTIGCRCTADVPLLFVDAVATLEGAVAEALFLEASPLTPPRDTALASQDFCPPLPPPR